ncbi:hypothetical protein SY83_01050 [Paenibacillus swuensis]|uniref:Peptidase M48 n=2 Tax=Paenibacillus swuensis TaxID=1178515 RepID=A0A172TNG4_9BACL|nr:hypothetical protein SY83_01050 [Paenibacillus swuensis]
MRRWGRRYLWGWLGFAVLIAVYLWFTTGTVPTRFQGTAADPVTFLTSAQIDRSQVYSLLGNWLYFVSMPWEWGIYLFLLFSGWSAALRSRTQSWVSGRWMGFPLYVLGVSGASFLLFLPIRIVGYSLSRGFGISVQPVGGWIRDKLLSFGISYVTLLAVSAVAFWFIRRGGRWWIKLWLLSVPFTLFMMYIQPVVIDPLYNTFTELSDPKLERAILELADKAGIPASRVYEVNMSEKTNALNAYVQGIGSSLRIVLWDTTLGRLAPEEVLIVMAHEMGHYVMHHLEWSAVGAVISSFFVLWIGSAVYRYIISGWGQRWGIRGEADIAALPLVLLLISLLGFVSAPFAGAVSRHAEQEADRYALQLIGNGSAASAVSLHQKLAATSLSDVDPPLLVRLFRSTHPSALERIIYALEAGQREGVEQ